MQHRVPTDLSLPPPPFPKDSYQTRSHQQVHNNILSPNAPKASLHYNSEPQHKIASNLSYWSEELTSR